MSKPTHIKEILPSALIKLARALKQAKHEDSPRPKAKKKKLSEMKK